MRDSARVQPTSYRSFWIWHIHLQVILKLQCPYPVQVFLQRLHLHEE